MIHSFSLLIVATISLFVFFVAAGYLLFVYYFKMKHKKQFVPFIPSDRKGLSQICERIDLQTSRQIIDVGSGWGTAVFHLAKEYPRARVVGVELHPVLHGIALIRQVFSSVKERISFVCQDAAKHNFRRYDTVFVFMLSDFLNAVLAPKLEQELEVGARVVSYVFPMTISGFNCKEYTISGKGWRSKVFVYTKM
jgi:tRNA A58 N-methylase Trm61